MAVVELAKDFDAAVASTLTARDDESTKMEAYYQAQDATRNAEELLATKKKQLLDAIEAASAGTVENIVEAAPPVPAPETVV